MKKLILLFTTLVFMSCNVKKKASLELAKSSYQVGAVDVLESVAKKDSSLFKELYYEVLENSKKYNYQLDNVFKK